MKYKAVILDLDNTLYEYDPVHQAGMSSVKTCFERKFPQTDIDTFTSELDKAKQDVKSRLGETASSHHRLLYFQRVLERLGLWQVDGALELYNAYWDASLQTMSLRTGALSFLENLKPYTTCILTDLTVHIQYRKLQVLGITDWIDCLVTSEECGIEKPNAPMFELALEKLGSSVKETCMIGDNFEKDIIGASKLGMDTFFLGETRDDLPANTVPFKSFEQILADFQGSFEG